MTEYHEVPTFVGGFAMCIPWALVYGIAFLLVVGYKSPDTVLINDQNEWKGKRSYFLPSRFSCLFLFTRRTTTSILSLSRLVADQALLVKKVLPLRVDLSLFPP